MGRTILFGETGTRIMPARTSIPRLNFVRADPVTDCVSGPVCSASTTEPLSKADSEWVTRSTLPLTWSKPRSHGPGLKNLGNTCYMNSALQCLLHLPPLDHALSLSPASNLARFCAHCAMVNLRDDVRKHGSSGSVAPRSFAYNVRSLSRTFVRGLQQDAHELLVALLESVTRASVLGCAKSSPLTGEILRRQDELSTPVHEIFGGMTQSCVTCGECGHVSSTLEPIRDLSLEITKARSIERALDTFTAPEYLYGENKYRCDGCRRKVNAEKRLSIRKAPNVLTLHLKRFNRTRKDTRQVSYPEILDLKPYMIGAPEKIGAKYQLCSVLIHHGNSKESGHYTAYVRGANGTWAFKDDAYSRTTSLRTALNQDAYLLFYTRIPDVVPVSRPIPVKSSAAHISTSVPSAKVAEPLMSASSSKCAALLPPRPQEANLPADLPSSSPGTSNSADFTSELDMEILRVTTGNAHENSQRSPCAVDLHEDSEQSTVPGESESSVSPSEDEHVRRVSETSLPPSPGTSIRSLLIAGSESVCRALRRAFGVPNFTLPPAQSSKVPEFDSVAPVPLAKPEPIAKPAPVAKLPVNAKPTLVKKAGMDVKQSAVVTKPTIAAAKPAVPSKPTSEGKGAACAEGMTQPCENIAPALRDSTSKSGLFAEKGVGVWDGAESDNRDIGSAPAVQKRKRHRDELDAEYDRGKAKKVKRKTEYAQKSDGVTNNPFTALSNRKANVTRGS